MKIYFCDVCNESIPLQDIKDNLATTVNGKIYCQNHNPIAVAQGIKGGKRSDKVSVLMLGVVIILLAAMIFLMVWERGDKDAEYALLADFIQVRDNLGEMSRKWNEFQAGYGTFKDETAKGVSSVGAFETDMEQLKRDLGDLRVELNSLNENLRGASNLRGKQDALDMKQKEFGDRLAGLEERVVLLKDKLFIVEGNLDNLIRSGVVSGGGAKGGKTSAAQTGEMDSAESEELVRLKNRLTSKDNGERFEAVNEVYDKRIKEALPYLLPLLEDPDQFDQVGAIQTVGEFLYLPAVPVLVKVLREPDVPAREEAQRWLIRMTGESGLEFDVRASKSERERAVKKWEEWLKKNNF